MVEAQGSSWDGDRLADKGEAGRRIWGVPGEGAEGGARSRKEEGRAVGSLTAQACEVSSWRLGLDPSLSGVRRGAY